MNNPEIQIEILRNLYEFHFTSEGKENLNEICEQGECDKTMFWNVANRMSHEGLIKAWAMGGLYRITAYGIIYSEEQGIAPEELLKENQHARILILDFLARVYEEHGNFADAYIEQLAEETELETGVLRNNLQVLSELGYIEPVAMGSYKITYSGLDAVASWRQRTSVAEEFETISKMRPQPRGRALQKLLAGVFEMQGWSQEEGARTSNEEMDIIVFQGREYYLFECKWEKDPIEASVIRELYGKLGNRVDVRGAVVSMSGFTSGAVKQVEDYVGSRVILLFGPNDVHSMVYGEATFDDLLDEKYRRLITQREIVFS